MALERAPIKGEPFLEASGSTWFPALEWFLQVIRSRNIAGDSHDDDDNDAY
jgi:hypothetical protein